MKIKSSDFYNSIRNYLTIYLPLQKVCSVHTIKSYREVINLFLDFLCDSSGENFFDLDFSNINLNSVNEFLQWLEDERDCKSTTVNHHLAVIRAFLKYVGITRVVYADKYIEIKNIPVRKVQQKLTVNHFDEDTLKMLLSQPNQNKIKEHRDLFFMILMYDTGARNAEILNLKSCDIRSDKTFPYIIIHGKGNKVRTVPIMKKTLEHYESYLKRMRLDGDQEKYLFFTTTHGERHKMSDDNVARFIKKYVDRARIEHPSFPNKITPHMFRHSRALSLYRNGVPISLISEWLGHANIETTYIYAYADVEMKRNAIEKAVGSNSPITSTEVSNKETTIDEIKRMYGLK